LQIGIFGNDLNGSQLMLATSKCSVNVVLFWEINRRNKLTEMM
jgi:hypothetical protein